MAKFAQNFSLKNLLGQNLLRIKCFKFGPQMFLLLDMI